MAFTYHGDLNPHGGPVLRREIGTNSITVTVLDSVKLASGFAALGTAGAAVFGHVAGISTEDGVGLNTTGAAGAEIGSFVGTFTMASDNQTVAKVKVEVDISQTTLYSAEVDATIGTTTGSDLSGYRMDLVDEDTLDESTAATTTAQYATWGVDPADSTKAIVNVFESQVFNS
jgi:hypothetical protein